jgi:hypothetical protein
LAVEPANTLIDDASRQWRAFAAIFVTVFVGGLALIYGFIVLMDPYGINPYSLPIRRAIVSISQRYMYPQLIRSHHFDSFVVGTSTSRLLDPRILNQMFHARFVNLGMDSMTAWEQSTVMDYFVRQVGAPKVVLVGLDGVWCDADAVRHRITSRGFPSWLYEDTPARAFAYLLNYGTFEIAGRLVGYQLGLHPTTPTIPSAPGGTSAIGQRRSIEAKVRHRSFPFRHCPGSTRPSPRCPIRSRS